MSSNWQVRIGMLLVFGGILGGIVLVSVAGGLWLPIEVVSWAMVFGGAFIWVRGRRKAVEHKSGENVIQEGQFNLLLRPFSADEGVLRTAFLLEITTQEEEFAAAMRPIASLITIGKPGEELPDFGAKRLYANGDEWQNKIRALIQEARFVVLRAGKGGGPGFQWELETLKESVDPEKLLIYAWMWRTEYERFSAEVNQVVGWQLPSSATIGKFGRVHGIVLFDNDWHSRFSSGGMPHLRRSLRNRYQLPIHYALKPIFERAGVDWRAPPVNPIAVLLAVIIGVSTLFLILSATL